MISEGKIAHEGVPLEVLHVDQDRDVIIDIGAYFGVYSVILAGLNRSIPFIHLSQMNIITKY